MAGAMRDLEIALPAGDPRREEALAVLQAGFGMEARVGSSARAFMREVLLFSDDYIENVISTVFLDDKPVDNIDLALLAEGSRLALSAAMPGLVGAIMRRGSPYASFREAITHRGEGLAGVDSPEAASSAAGSSEAARILVRVKIFNSVMRDRGPGVLARGIVLTPERAAELCATLGVAAPQGLDSGADSLLRFRIVESPA
ncbi:MAG: hypothetical protein ACOYM2_19480 [Rectinemataceae bacterium]